jgi:subtilisin-like proprotein convertase family protein
VLNLNGTHTWINDLDFNLSSPAATEVQIMSPSCADSDNFDLSLDDEATPGAWPCPPVGGGTYQPSNPLSAFDGQNSSGNWTLTINDNEDPDGGSLEGWSLEICGEPVFADFGGTPTSGIAPLTVNFTNLSSGGFDTCVWDFGDGGDSTSCGNPSHEFTAAGTYTVSLAVSGPGGNDTETKTDYITVDHNPFVYLPMIIRTD